MKYVIEHAFDGTSCGELRHFYQDYIELEATTEKEAFEEAEYLQYQHDNEAIFYLSTKDLPEQDFWYTPCYTNHIHAVEGDEE